MSAARRLRRRQQIREREAADLQLLARMLPRHAGMTAIGDVQLPLPVPTGSGASIELRRLTLGEAAALLERGCGAPGCNGARHLQLVTD